jgi:hypothetical protein
MDVFIGVHTTSRALICRHLSKSTARPKRRDFPEVNQSNPGDEPDEINKFRDAMAL